MQNLYRIDNFNIINGIDLKKIRYIIILQNIFSIRSDN